MSDNIELRVNIWYATLTIPKDARTVIGKFKFHQTLGTGDRKVALGIKAPLIALWKAQIAEARGQVGAVADEAQRWKGYLAQATGVNKDVLETSILEKALEIKEQEGDEKAGDFYKVAMGYSTLLNSHYDKWVYQISLVPKTKAQTVKDVNVFLARFTTIEKVTKQKVKEWVDEIQAQGYSIGTANRLLISSRNYWRYLQQQNIVSVDSEPLSLKGLLPTAKKKNKNGWMPFEPSSIISIWEEAISREDQSLADLIYLGAYTGARIEEICAMKLNNVTDKFLKIVDSKTNAGIREVPIHSKLKLIINRLKDSSTDGYLLTGLTFNKYSDRSNNLGKRFGKLKTKLGHSRNHVFHSIRKTFVTLLENAGVSEGVTADIVGHEKKTMTYGLYSGGNSLEIKKAAIELVNYDFVC